MSNQHTPGPWMYQGLAGDHDFAVYGESGKDIALVRNFNEANARLIAAAPELLRMLQSVVFVIGTNRKHSAYFNLVDDCKAAIANATDKAVPA